MARMLRTPRVLADEVAIILNDHAAQEAQRLLAAKSPAPTGDTLLDSMIRGHYAEMKRAQDAIKKREQQAAWDQLYAAQQRQKQ